MGLPEKGAAGSISAVYENDLTTDKGPIRKIPEPNGSGIFHVSADFLMAET
jgi:hypothetical protein